MSENPSPLTLADNFSDESHARFVADWLARSSDAPPPRWQDHLPAPDAPCTANLIRMILKVDIECRIKAGLPALLAERYFEHPRLQQADARLDAKQQMELIQWEYQQRWQNGQQARRAEYEAAFAQHAEAVRELKPLLSCPRCRQVAALEETLQTFFCPLCGAGSPSLDVSSVEPADLDLRGYRLIEKLGEGGMGAVYHSCDPALGRDVVIKVIKAEGHEHPVYVRRFLREARITGSLQHPGIVAVHNLGRLPDGRLHYTMRLVRGRTFADILKKEAGKPERLPSHLDVFKTICQAVGYAHSKRVIHRDLKPHNVMVGKFGEVQVMDWGLAKLLTADEEDAEPQGTQDVAGTQIHTEPAETPLDLTRGGSEFGSPPYMPPEQALGEWSLVDERADVFALGSILCELLTGKPAYFARTRQEVLWKAKRGGLAEALSRLDQCGADAALTALCRECLSLELQQRPRDAGVVAQRVAEYHAEVEARLRKAELERTEAEVKTREERKRRRLAMLLSAAVLLVFVAGALISTLFALDAGRQAEAARNHAKDAEIQKKLADKNAEQAENQKKLADKNAEQAEQEKHRATLAQEEAEQTLIEGLLRPIDSQARNYVYFSNGGYHSSPLSSAEREVFTTLARLPSDRIRMRFLKEGLRTTQKARRLSRSATWVIQATVGFNASRRHQVEELLLRRLQDREAPLDVREACVMMGIALDIQDTKFSVLVGEIIHSSVIHSLQKNNTEEISELLSVASGRMGADYAAKIADLLVSAMSKTTDINALNWLSSGLSSVSERLDAAAAAKAADVLGAAISKTTVSFALNGLSSGLSSVSGRLDAAAAAKAADLLVAAMRKTTNANALNRLSSGLSSVSGRLDAATAATYAAKAADLLVAAMSKTNQLLALHWLSHGLALVSGRLDTAAAAKAADLLVAAMSKTTEPNALNLLSSGLSSVSKRLDAAAAAKAADLLVAAMSKTTDANALHSLSTGLSSVSKRLDAAAAATYAAKAADLLLAAMSKTTQPNALFSLSTGLSSVSGRLDAAAAATYAAKAADLLLAAMSKTTQPNALSSLSTGLSSVSGRLDAAAAARIAELLIAAMSKTTETDALFGLFSDLSSLIDRLDVASAVKLLKTVMSKHTFDIANISFANAERWNTLVVLAYLQHPLAAGPTQRQLLDVLEHRTHRHFRNTWHFLDWARSNGVDFTPAN